MAKLSTETKTRIQNAIGSIPARQKFTVPKLAKEFNISVHQLRNRLNGTPSRHSIIPINRKLSVTEERAVCWYIDQLDKIGMCVRPPMLRNTANVILSQGYTRDNPPPTVGVL